MSEALTIIDDEGDEIEVPSVWAICSNCRGEGKHIHDALRVLTSSDVAEHQHEDGDFMENYMGGVYDVGCESCGGSGKVREPDFGSMDDDLKKAARAHFQGVADDRAEELAERRMGA